MNWKQLVFNLVTRALALSVNVFIAIFFTPFMVRRVGTQAYGFIGLSNNFIQYMQLIAVALNSMAGRFITIKIHEKDVTGASRYFSSSFIANVVMSLALTIPFGLFLPIINIFLSVPVSLLQDVQLLFLFSFVGYVTTIIGSTFSVYAFATNRLDLAAMRGVEASLINVAILIVLCVVFKPEVWFIGASSALSAVYICITNVIYTRRLLPQIKIAMKLFEFKALKEVLSSGAWASLTQLGQILNTGLDLLLANIFLGSKAMGILAIAKTVPSFIQTLTGTLSGVFIPENTKLYAQGRNKELAQSVGSSVKIMGLVSSIPMAGLIAFGKVFYSLWVPNENASLLQLLSILTIAAFSLGAALEPLYNIFEVMNRLKLNTIVTAGAAMFSCIVTLFLLKTTHLGVLAIAGVSTAVGIVRIVTFLPIYSAALLRERWWFFYKPIIKNIISIVAITILGIVVKDISHIHSWRMLIVDGIITSGLGVLLNTLIILSITERRSLVGRINYNLRRISRRSGN